MDNKKLIVDIDFKFDKNNNSNNNSDFIIDLSIKEKFSTFYRIKYCFKIHFFEYPNDYEFSITTKKPKSRMENAEGRLAPFKIENMEDFMVSRDVFNKIKDSLEYIGISDTSFVEKVFNELISNLKSI